jgi:tellurite resistance protein
MTAIPGLLACPSATIADVLAAAAKRRTAVLMLWRLKRLDTFDIAEMLEIHEAEVVRIIHTDREMRRNAAAA